MINGKYTVKRKIGEGRNKVFLVEDCEVPGRHFALKVLHKKAGAEEVESLKNEYRILKRLNHPNIITPFEYGTVAEPDEAGIDAGMDFFTMEYFPGNNLLSFFNGTQKQLTEIIIQISAFLFYLHQSNYVYLDLKPDNILALEQEGKTILKFIDFGFAERNLKKADVRGTAEYISPEILQKGEVTYKTDLYSFGILLYRLVYGKFPFQSGSEISLYKAHLKKEFEFPESSYGSAVVAVIKTLLNKNPELRYSSSLQIFNELKIPIDRIYSRDFTPAKVFTAHQSSLNILNAFLKNEETNEIISVNGSEGAGKTFLLQKFESLAEDVIFFENTSALTNIELYRAIIRKIAYFKSVFPNLTKEARDRVTSFLTKPIQDIVTELKGVFTAVSSGDKFCLMLDDFNTYSSYDIDNLKEIFPILLVNRIKIIIIQDNDKNIVESLRNISEISLNPFTDVQVNEFVEKSYFNLFPKEELKKIILLYSDLIPGNIEGFIRDLLLFDILQYTPSAINIKLDSKKIELLKSSHENIYSERIKSLRREELSAAVFISAFDVSVKASLIAGYMGLSPAEAGNILHKLEQKNILRNLSVSLTPVFTSEALKKYVYSLIEDKKKYYFSIAGYIRRNVPNFSKTELARHYEIAGKFRESFIILNEELEYLEKINAYKFQADIVKHLLGIPVDGGIKDRLKYKLSIIYYNLNEYRKSLDVINGINPASLQADELEELNLIKARCLIESGEIEEGKILLLSMLKESGREEIKQKISIEIANAEFELNHYSEARKYIENIISNSSAQPEVAGRAYNMLGLTEIYKDNNLDNALEHFLKAVKIYGERGLNSRLAGMEINIGNIYNIKGEFDKAEYHWNNALKINFTLGNLDSEARVHVSFGILYFERLLFNKSLESYQRAYGIFYNLGNKSGTAIVLANLGENYTVMCEYQKAYDTLNESRSLFAQLSNHEEEAEVLFNIGLLNYTTGDFKALNRDIEDYEKILQNYNLVERHEANYRFLKFIAEYRSMPDEDFVINGNKLIESFTVLAAYKLINTFRLIFAEELIYRNRLNEAAMQVKWLNKHTGKNYLLCANYHYLLGLIAKKSNLSPIDHFEKAFDILHEEEISEIIFKVLYQLAAAYYMRGNSGKCREFTKYAKSLLSHISSTINDENLKHSFLNHPYRQKALQELTLFENELIA